ncbi:DUF5074 domain-containing protein [Chitinophagaceae bacterium 26-R-25]|nr:DUF5074 domain-containing protein [Chitinophagaceae bacterium 26-R-25]
MYSLRSLGKRIVLPLSLMMFSIVACNKNNDYKQPLPQIVDNSIKDGKDTITIGGSLLLYPKLNNRTTTSYSWTVNGTQAGTDSTLSFKPDAAGKYLINFTASNTTGQASANYQIYVLGKYENGILIVNEGWFGHENGGVNFYRYGSDTIEQNVYAKENPGKQLGTTTEFGAVFNGRLYLVSKQGPFVVTDSKSLVEVGRIESLPANGRAFLGVDSTTGLITTQSGIYPLNLQTLAIGTKLSSVSGQVGNIIAQGNYIFALTQTDGVVVLNKSDYSVAKKIAGLTEGFTTSSDGSVWVAGGTSLVKINPSTLDTTKVTLPFSAANTWGAWTSGSLTFSATENAIFIAKEKSWGSNGTSIYKYVIGNVASLQNPFATLPTGKELYGCATRYNPLSNHVVVTAVQSGYGQNYKYNSLYFYNASTGNLDKTVSYENFYFPSLMLFN